MLCIIVQPVILFGAASGRDTRFRVPVVARDFIYNYKLSSLTLFTILAIPDSRARGEHSICIAIYRAKWRFKYHLHFIMIYTYRDIAVKSKLKYKLWTIFSFFHYCFNCFNIFIV